MEDFALGIFLRISAILLINCNVITYKLATSIMLYIRKIILRQDCDEIFVGFVVSERRAFENWNGNWA